MSSFNLETFLYDGGRGSSCATDRCLCQRHAFLPHSKGSSIDKKLRITNHRNFLHPSHGIVLDDKTNHELIPAFKTNVHYEYYTPLVEKRLYYPVALTCVDCDWLTCKPTTWHCLCWLFWLWSYKFVSFSTNCVLCHVARYSTYVLRADMSGTVCTPYVSLTTCYGSLSQLVMCIYELFYQSFLALYKYYRFQSRIIIRWTFTIIVSGLFTTIV